MTNQSQLTPDELEKLQQFARQYGNNAMVLSKILGEYAKTTPYKPLVSDNPTTIIRHEGREPDQPHMQAGQSDSRAYRRWLD